MSYDAASTLKDMAEIEAAQKRIKGWLHAELKAGGLHPDVEPCRATDHGNGSLGCWAGASNLSGARAFTIVWYAHSATVFLQSYAGHTTFASMTSPTVALAVKALLALPNRGGVPKAMIASAP